MRLTRLIAVLVIVATSASGCLLFRDCMVHTRRAVWVQDEPVLPKGELIEYEMGELWGGVVRHPETDQLHLMVHGNNSVSHEELVSFGEAMFAEKGWPRPQLERARESASCGDDY